MSTSTSVVERLRGAFVSGRTRPFAFRRQQLKRLVGMLEENRQLWYDAVYQDLRKSATEAELTEVAFTTNEAKHAFNHLRSWTQPTNVAKGLAFTLDDAFVQRQPFGVSLIIGAWNYPINLVLSPLVGAIAAGNAAVLKPSEMAPATSALLQKLLPRYLDPDCFAVVVGGIPETTALLKERFDLIFYTGSSMVGKIVMEAAAKNLTPVVLELGGKSPVYVDERVDLAKAARVIAWGKLMNCGQTCVCPDYVMINPKARDRFVRQFKKAVEQFYGANPKSHPDYARIVNSRHLERIQALVDKSKVVFGGEIDPDDLYIAPTVMTEVNDEDAVMKDEIFGPVLPIVDVASPEEAVARINAGEKPLALYCFTKDPRIRAKFLAETSSGGIVFNDVVFHLLLDTLPFGGVGHSGMGAYHGKHSFEAFSHRRSVLVKSLRYEPILSVRYPPYSATKLTLAQWLVGKSFKNERGLSFLTLAVGATLFAAFMLHWGQGHR